MKKAIDVMMDIEDLQLRLQTGVAILHGLCASVISQEALNSNLLHDALYGAAHYLDDMVFELEQLHSDALVALKHER